MNNKLANYYKYLVLIPGVLFGLFFIFKTGVTSSLSKQFTLSDDVMISMTYAKTLAESGSFVWYESSPRVQGYTNFLWTIFLTLIHLFNLSGSLNALFVSLLNLILLILCAITVIEILHTINPDKKNQNLFFGSLILIQYPLIFWSYRGFEIPLFLLCLMLLLNNFLKIESETNISNIKKYIIRITIFSIIGFLTRLDFLIPLAVMNILFLFRNFKNKDIFRIFFISNVFSFLTFVSLLLFQKNYYGSFLPNTYYLKVGGFSLLEKIPRGIFSTGKILPLIFLIYFMIIFSSKEVRSRYEYRLISYTLISLVFYNIYVGGDAWEVYGFANRFLSISIPFMFFLVVFADEFNLGKLKKPQVFFLSISFYLIIFTINSTVNPLDINFMEIRTPHLLYWFLLTILLFLSYLNKNIHYVFGILITIVLSLEPMAYFINNNAHILKTEYLNTEIGKELQLITTENAKVGVFWAGSIAYYSEREMIDFLGKSDDFVGRIDPKRNLNNKNYNFNDFHPGHNKWDFQYSIGKLKPDIILREWPDENFDLEIKKNNYKKECILISRDNYPTKFDIFILSESKSIIYENITFCE